MNFKPFAILSALAALGGLGQAATGAAWLHYPNSARHVAEAGGLGVLAQGAGASGLNPAGLAALQARGEVQASHSGWAAGINAEHVGAAWSAPGLGVLGLAGTWVDLGAVQGYELAPGGGVNETVALRPQAASLGGAWATGLGRGLQAGVGLRLLTQDLDGRGAAWAPSLEVGLQATLGAGFSLGASLLHLGPDLDGSPLPREARLGLAWASAGGGLGAGVEMAADAHGVRAPDLLAALRLRLAEGFSARLGWRQLEGAEAQPTAGLGFQVGGRWSLDYAFQRQGDLGSTHHLGLGLRWL